MGSAHAPGVAAARVTVLYTIGHSTRTYGELVEALAAWEVGTLVDIRHFTRSRANPQFNATPLRRKLARDGITYVTLPLLGGRRGRARDVDPDRNAGWTNASFKNYADYAETPAFAEGLASLLALAAKDTCAIMCAEAVWWRCHRSLIADDLCVRGIEVVHIMDAKHSTVHPMTKPARVVEGRLTYASPEQQSLL